MTYEIIEYTNDNDQNLFREWFFSLDAKAAAKVTTAITRLENGNTSNVKGVGGGVYEYKINFGPGYRVYFAYDGKTLSFYWPAEASGSNLRTLRQPKPVGPIIRSESRDYHGTDTQI